MPYKYKVSGTLKIPKDKAATFGYDVFETNDIEKMSEYINTHAVIPCKVKDGHRLKSGVEEIYPWIRLDVDKKREAKKIDKALKKVEYIKKPSTNNEKYPYKWHYFIPIENVSQNYDEYKLQYHHFLTEFGIEIYDKSLSSVVQNTNPYSGTVEDAQTLTTYNKRKRWIAPKVKVPKKKESVAKQSDIPKEDIKKMLKNIDPDCSYQEWLQVGFALYDWCPKRGFKLFDKWSKKSDKYDGTTVDKWSDFAQNASGDITIGTLVHLAYGEKLPDPVTLFKKVDKGVVGVKKNYSSEEVEQKKKEFNLLNIEGVMDDAELERQAKEVILFEGLLAEGYHTVLYGAAGSNKTTISSWACVQMLKEFPTKIVHYWAFDSDRIHNNEIYKYTKSEGVNDRFLLITQKSADYFEEYYNEARDHGYDLSNLVIVIDTYKFITSDVNSKAANKKVLHEIKRLQTLGASILTLSHANKDGANFSGTGELSQDTDALMVISREKDEDSGNITTTIKTETRSRFGVPTGGITLMSNGKDVKGAEYHNKIFNNLKKIENRHESSANDIDVFAKEKEIKAKKKLKEIEDTKEIKEITRIIKYLKNGENTKALQTTIVNEAKAIGLSERQVLKILRDYDDVHWTWKDYRHKNGGRPTKQYKLIKPKKE